MKNILLLWGCLVFSGCSLGQSSEVRRAEKLMQNFQCNNVEITEISRSNINNFHQQSLLSSKSKALHYIEQYKSGDTNFNRPLDTAIEQQFQLYKSACESLGGIHPEMST